MFKTFASDNVIVREAVNCQKRKTLLCLQDYFSSRFSRNSETNS